MSAEAAFRTTCSAHGPQPWALDVICDGCGLAWQVRSSREPRFAPAVCACGLPLLPSAGAGTFYGRPACARCCTRPVGEA